MSKIYVRSTSSYSRSDWDSSSAGYTTGDRVSYDDKVYVCIQDHTSAEQPDSSSDYWVLAGTREYPFHNKSGLLMDIGNSTLEYNIFPTKQNDPTNFGAYMAGKNGTVVLLKEDEDPDWELNAVPGNPSPSVMGNQKIIADKLHTKIIIKASLQTSDIYPWGAGFSTFEGFYLHMKIGGFITAASSEGCGWFFKNCVIDFQADQLSSQFVFGYLRVNVSLNDCLVLLPDGFRSIFYENSSHHTDLPSAKDCTFVCNILSDLHSGESFCGNGIQENNIYYINDGNGQSGDPFKDPISAKNNCFFKKNSARSITESQGINTDPLFIDPSSNDYRLRPESPLIGGAQSSSKQSQLESQYPNGKWFDSHAAAGGDGSWETPYNSYADAIDSFTGDEAVVLIKEGQHSLHQGYWSRTYTGGNSAWNPSHDLPKAYPNGIKFIGMGSDSIFDTSGDGITNYAAFWSYDNVNPNIRDTPFVFKDFDILMNNSGFINRGLISARRAEYVNVNVTQAPDLGAINSQLFDYTTHSGSGNSGEYLKMSGCTINVSLSNNSTNNVFLVGNSGGLKQFQSCTFVDLNRTTSTIDLAPHSFVSYNFGSYTGSFIKDCIIYSKTTNTRHFGSSATNSSSMYQGSPNLEIKNVAVYSTNQTVAVGSNFGDKVSTIDPKFVATEPHDFDLRLRPDSPLIGGIKSDLTNVYYLQPGNPYNGDGSQKDASAMTADGDPGPFNEFKEIIAAGVPYGSKIIIVNGTYDWSQALGKGPSNNINATTWQEYAYAGYNYVAETMHKVIFDAKQGASNIFVYKPYGGTIGAGVFLDLDTTFTGVQFNNMAAIDASTRNMITSVSGSAGLGSCTFKRCKFLGHISTMSASFPWTGGQKH